MPTTPPPTSDTLLRLLDGTLPPAEAAALRARLAADEALQARYDRLAAMQGLVRSTAPTSFAPYFSERVLKRLAPDAASPEEALYASLRWLFVRAAVASLVLIVVLGGVNATAYQDLGVASTLVEAVFGLPSDGLLDALTYNGL